MRRLLSGGALAGGEEEEEQARLCMSYREYSHYADLPVSPELLGQLRAIDPLFLSKEEKEVEVKEEGEIAVVVFDTETSGLSRTDVVIQLGYVGFDSLGAAVVSYERVWRSEVVPGKHAVAVHGISTQDIRASPYPAGAELGAFLGLLSRLAENGGCLVAHNADFDLRMLRQTMQREGLHFDFRKLRIVCTLQGVRGRSVQERGSSCKNEAVCRFLGGTPDAVLHRALADARATAYVYFTGVARGWW